jgi:hypothetical protein
MNEKLEGYLADLVKNDAEASEASILDLENQLCCILPQGYKDFMKKSNGAEGEIGENAWLCLFPVEELIKTNEDYSLLMQQIPDYFLVGKDAADTGYAFHKQNGTFHSFGLMSNFKTDPVQFCGNDFVGFIEYLYNE